SGVTTTTANDMLVYAVGIIIVTTVNVPSGFTQVWRTSSSSDTASEMSQELFASAGATGTIHGTHNGGANSNITMLIALKPAGATRCDVMVAHVIVQTAGNVITRPTGWNLVLRQDTSSAIATATYVKVAGSSEPASYTWSFGTAGQASGGIASYMGVNTTTPVDASHAQYNLNTRNVNNTGLNTRNDNDM